jgi:hypothetical protein
MKPGVKRLFWDIEAADIPAFARSAAIEAGMPIPPAHAANVEENLRVLLGHARIVAAALPAGALDAPPETFAP